MPVLQRSSVVRRGPVFWLDGDETIMFDVIVDSSTRAGPRPATAADKEAHPEAWAAFVDGNKDVPALTPLITALDPDWKPPAPERPHATRRDQARVS